LTDFQNPQQQDPGTQRNMLLAFAIAFLIILASQPLMKKYGPKPPEPAPITIPQPAAQPPVALQSAPGQPGASANTTGTASAPAVTRQAATEAEFVVENDLYKIRFTNHGGLAKSWVLKKFKDDKGDPLELVNAAAAARYGLPLSLFTYDGALQQRLNQALYVTTSTGSIQAPADVTFEFADQDFVVSKSFHFDQSYLVDVKTSARYKGADLQAFPAWPSSFGDGTAVTAYGYGQIEYQTGEKVERLAPKKISGGSTTNGPLHWAGPTDRYFAAVFIPADPYNATLVSSHNTLDIPKDPDHPNPNDTVKVDVLGAAVGDRRGPTSEQLYVGPKSLEILEKLPVAPVNGAAPDLTELVNFGFFKLIAKPLFIWLKWTYYHVVSNWGWAIVLQTLIINLLLMPLRITQMKSALKMQKIAPQQKAIQAKYEKYSMRDPRKAEMNKEIGELFKREGVNPVAGCLPLLIQMPFLYAYYSMLGAVIDLRQAHWAWIHDLSTFDPLYLLPVAVFASMFLQLRMTPQGGMDPQQQKIMNMFMPVMMAYITSKLAAGLALYWSVGNVISIVQQIVMNKTSLGQEMRELAAKRARKKK
jgi:YidC/Oxa1 family membrane protein insertase